MVIEQIVNGGRQILFSGTASQVEAAFTTTMRTYQVDGESHHANATEPQIPRVLSSVVSGVVSLHDFRAQPANRHVQLTSSQNTWYYNGYQQSALVPGDLAKIYNATPLYTAAIDGTGQSIAVIGRSNIDLAEVRLFRTTYGLPAKDPQVILAGVDPGIVCGEDDFESAMDVEYAGAIAKHATVKFVVAASTPATDGIYLAAQYAVSHNVAPIVSLSYGLCEKVLGTSGNAFMNSLWQQAAAQGMSVFVASMDSGAAGCDNMNAAVATGGLGVNGLGSTPYNTAVGGTQFDDVYNRSTYWAASNDPVTQASALGYIPELAWNQSREGDLLSSGGGMSSLYPKPAWQFGLGVAPDGKRDIPDVAFAASIQDPYRINVDKQVMGGGGTSAATPVFASIMALVLQKVGQSQGLVNPVLYALAYNQNYSNGAAVFHDVTVGNNTVSGVTDTTPVLGSTWRPASARWTLPSW
jgi:subtilase family serine protease